MMSLRNASTSSFRKDIVEVTKSGYIIEKDEFEYCDGSELSDLMDKMRKGRWFYEQDFHPVFW